MNVIYKVEKIVNDTNQNENESTKETNENITTIWINLHYNGDQSQQLVRSLERKLRRSLIRD